MVLTPALGQPPVRIGEIDSCSADPLGDFRRSGHFTPYTALSNVTGQPALSVPLFQGDDGLPLGIQLVGAPAREDVLLSLGAQLEAARPWADRRPELAAAYPSTEPAAGRWDVTGASPRATEDSVSAGRSGSSRQQSRSRS